MEEAIETTLQDLARDYFFLFCVHFTCDRTYNVSHEAVVYQKEHVTKVIMDIVDRWYMFPVPFKVLKRGMNDIICLTFMRPSYEANKKRAIICGMLYPIAHIPGLTNADREALKQLFHAIVRRLLTEDPTVPCLRILLETLTVYFNADDVQERALATSSIHILLANALKYNNLSICPLAEEQECEGSVPPPAARSQWGAIVAASLPTLRTMPPQVARHAPRTHTSPRPRLLSTPRTFNQ
ncbi:uncharacterized protein LOC117040463 [Lacerta agilis]|uniref:uncharacterized protein LOC117040463 n=1 Tax=Lacerta agilis TaxID=80427 RepID=UPI001419804E|nr:uncharacterized protein LOC117040463 [Lacerta agilis]